MKMNEYLEEIQDKLHNVRVFFRRQVRRIKRLIAWFPIIWKDEDWDYGYLFEIMRFKISRIRNEVETNKRHVGWEKHVQQMKVAEELLNRQAFSEFYYDNDEKNKTYCKCPPLEDMFKNKDEEYTEIDGRKFIRWESPFCDWCNRKTQRRRQDKKEKEEYEFLWDHLRRHSRKWWD